MKLVIALGSKEYKRILDLRSGRHIVARGDVDAMVDIVRALKVVRNDDAHWSNIATPWGAMEDVLAASGLDRSCAHPDHNGIDPFSRLSVYEGKKKVASVWK